MKNTAPAPQLRNPLCPLFKRGNQDPGSSNPPPLKKGAGGILKTLLQLGFEDRGGGSLMPKLAFSTEILSPSGAAGSRIPLYFAVCGPQCANRSDGFLLRKGGMGRPIRPDLWFSTREATFFLRVKFLFRGAKHGGSAVIRTGSSRCLPHHPRRHSAGYAGRSAPPPFFRPPRSARRRF